MRAPAQEPLWAGVKTVIERLGIDVDQALVTSHQSGRKVTTRDELKLIGELAVALRETETPTARSIANMLDDVLADIESAQRGVNELADQHWPMGGWPEWRTARPLAEHSRHSPRECQNGRVDHNHK